MITIYVIYTWIKFVITILIFLYSQNVNANIIRDSEIEETINLVIHPLKKASGLKDLSIYILNDPSSNAFTVGGNTIFINNVINNITINLYEWVYINNSSNINGKNFNDGSNFILSK